MKTSAIHFPFPHIASGQMKPFVLISAAAVSAKLLAPEAIKLGPETELGRTKAI